MRHIKEFILDESNIDSYSPPKFIVKPAPNDTGYELVRKNYKRWLWTLPKLGKNKGKIDKGPVNEDAFGADLSEIPGMGTSDSWIASGTVGYMSGPSSSSDNIPADYYEDPDERKKREDEQELKNVKAFKDFVVKDHKK